MFYVPALSSIHPKIDNYCVGQHSYVINLLKDILNNRPPKPRYTLTWDIHLVTHHLKDMGLNQSLPLKRLSWTLATLFAITCPKRVSSITSLDLNHHRVLLEEVDFILAVPTKGTKSLMKMSKAFLLAILLRQGCVQWTVLSNIWHPQKTCVKHNKEIQLIHFPSKTSSSSQKSNYFSSDSISYQRSRHWNNNIKSSFSERIVYYSSSQCSGYSPRNFGYSRPNTKIISHPSFPSHFEDVGVKKSQEHFLGARCYGVGGILFFFSSGVPWG